MRAPFGTQATGKPSVVALFLIITIIPQRGPLGVQECPGTSCRSLGFMWLTSGLREASVEAESLSPRPQGRSWKGLRPLAAPVEHLLRGEGGAGLCPAWCLVPCLTKAYEHW